MKRALITGITGQDGRYLSPVPDRARATRSSASIRGQANPKAKLVRTRTPALELVDGDLRDLSSLIAAVEQVQPDEVYNLGAISFVQLSFKQAELTAEITGLGVLRMLEAVRIVGGTENNPIRFYQASSSEMFGKVRETPQTETHAVPPALAVRRRQGVRPRHDGELPRGLRHPREQRHPLQPRGPNGAASSSSPARSPTSLARIKLGLQDAITSATSTPPRDWGYAGDYVEAMWMMLQQDEPDDYVIATGETHTDPRVPRRRVPHRRLRRLGAVRHPRPALRPSGRGRPAHRRRRQGAREARLEAARSASRSSCAMMYEHDLDERASQARLRSPLTVSCDRTDGRGDAVEARARLRRRCCARGRPRG